ncbi:hypothetical protein PHLCEN_2v10047 [Hermanssonia centrifuga]|uniref:Uncharacterized protein n=1 Tax=Hermanssonia centrifuga TaxID=98765 RepID=A0A2R6NNR2_9APHY|nr:hypothetical protein PHLCEN_2v10047 [Hermanssonia centrifuga]
MGPVATSGTVDQGRPPGRVVSAILGSMVWDLHAIQCKWIVVDVYEVTRQIWWAVDLLS